LEEGYYQDRDDDIEINLFDLLIALAKRKVMIISITLGAAIIALISGLVITPIYNAETRILIPQKSSTGIASQLQMLDQGGISSTLAAGSLGMRSQNDLYMALLSSRPVLDRVIVRFDLIKLYGIKSYEDIRKVLRGKISVKDDKKSGIITVGIEDKEPKMAAEMANAFIEELHIMNKGISVTEAAQRRLFFEDQLKDSKASLEKAEDAMKDFQERTGAVKIDSQAASVIEGIAQLRAQIAAKEVQLKVMRTYSTSQNPDILRAGEELKGMAEQLARLETKKDGGSVVFPTGNIPSASTEYMRRMRELKFNETLYGVLLSQYEAAKLDEARDASVIQVIEKAVPPERKVKPKRARMIIFATILGFFVSIVTAFAQEYIERASSDPENSGKFETLKRSLSFRLNG
jgi:tyrosine-protein kinase Etk/Wzc